MAHASPLLTPARGSTPSSTQDLHLQTSPPAWGEAPHTSLGSRIPSAPRPLLLVSEEFSGSGAAGTGPSITSPSTCRSPGVFSAARPWCDDLNTPDIDPPTPFQFPSTSELESTELFSDGHLMDAIFAATKHDEAKEVTTFGLGATDFVQEEASAAAHLLGTLTAASALPVALASVYEVSAPNSVMGGAYHGLASTQPALLDTTMAYERGTQETPLENLTMEASSMSVGICSDVVVPHGNAMVRPKTERFGESNSSVNMTNETQVHLDSWLSDSYANVDTIETCAQVKPDAFSDNLEAVPSSYAESAFFAPLPGKFVSDSRSAAEPQTTMLLQPSSAAIPGLDTVQDDSNEDWATLGQMDDDEMKSFDDFCDKMNNDDLDFLSDALGDEESSALNAVTATSMGELDHFSILSSSQEPGQLLTSKLEDNNRHVKVENKGMAQVITPLASHGFSNSNQSEVNSGPWKSTFMETLSGSGNCSSLQAVNAKGFPDPRAAPHFLNNHDLELNTPAPTPMRRLITSDAKKILNSGELKEKLEMHLQTQECLNNASSSVAGVGSDDACGLGDPSAREPNTLIPPVQHSPFRVQFDAAFNIPSTASPERPKQDNVIRVAVMKENKSRVRALHKPLKRLSAESIPCLSIRTKKFKVSSNSDGGQNRPLSASASLGGDVAHEACFIVARNVANGSGILGGNNARNTLCIPQKTIISTGGKVLNVGHPQASASAPSYLILRPANGGPQIIKFGRPVTNSPVTSNAGNDTHLVDHSRSAAAPLGGPALNALVQTKDSSISSTLVGPAASKCSQFRAPIPSTSGTCKPTSNVVQLTTDVQRVKREVITSVSLAEDDLACDSDGSDASYEPPPNYQSRQARSSVVGFSRLPRSEQQALDAEKYRRNLKANNLASTKSRLKKKNARLALEDEVKCLSQQRAKRQLLFEKLRNQYDVMNKAVVGRPCCPSKK